MWRRTTAWLLLAFALSVVVRWPQLNRPLSKHHEFCTAVALIIMQVWDEEGFYANEGLPCVTFPGEANAYVVDQTDGLVQRDGKQYYLSHVPFAYYLPFAFFHTIGVHPDVLPLQLFNLLFHLCTALMLMRIVRLLLRESDVERSERAALIAGMFYLFMPAMLWYHGNVYMADMFVQNLWVFHLYFALKLFTEAKLRRSTLLWFALTLALTAFTNWLGVFAGAASATLALQRWRSDRQGEWWALIAVCATSVLVPVCWTLWRYASITGWESLLAHYGNRYEERGSEAFGGIAGFCYFVWRLFFNYITAFAPLVLLLAGAWMIRKRKRSVDPAPALLKTFAWLSLVPVALDHLIFLKYALHEFAVLKASFFLCVLAAVWLSEWRRAVLMALPTCLAGVLLFHVINPAGSISQNGDRYDAQQQLGRAIAAQASPDATVFVAPDVPRDPMVILYAHRNLQRVKDAGEARAFLRQHARTQGVLFSVKGEGLVSEPISTDP